MSNARVNSTKTWWVVIYAGVLLLSFAAFTSCRPMVPVTSADPTATPIPPDGQIPINIVNEIGEPFSSGVLVRVSNSSQVDGPDNDGLHIESCDPNTQVIAAWAEGYEVAFRTCDDKNIQLTRLSGRDNINYGWISAIGNCIYCHAGQIRASYDEVTEWLKSGHAKVFDQRYFETMYRGINLSGRSSPVTQWTVMSNKLVRLPPTLDDNYYGPGFKLDYPEQPGNCAYCHVPAAVTPARTNVDLSNLFPKPGDVRGEGITCDICHKVLDVTLDNNGFPFVDRPGILSFRFLRPDNSTFTIGPFANILTRGSNIPTDHQLTCSSIFSQSEFCAACHYGKFGDRVIYNSYGEWRQSAYGDNPAEADYKTCQDCHMSHMNPNEENPPPGKRQACSESDPSFQNFDHNMMGSGIDESTGREIPLMVKGAANLKVNFKYEPDKKDSLDVIVKVKNTKAGHKFPTDSPLRHLILVVEAKDQLGTSLTQVEGERIPNWGGMGKPFLDSYGIKNYGGLPGKIFANLLVEADTDISPTGAYWNDTKLAWVNGKSDSDTRLVHDKEDKSDYSFTIPQNGEIKVTVTLVYRYAFFDLILEKEWWNRPDIIVTSVVCKGPAKSPDNIKCETVE